MIINISKYRSDEEFYQRLIQHKTKYVPEKRIYSSAKIWREKDITLNYIILDPNENNISITKTPFQNNNNVLKYIVMGQKNDRSFFVLTKIGEYYYVCNMEFYSLLKYWNIKCGSF